MRIAFLIVGVLAVVVIVVLVIGQRLPAQHRVTVTRDVPASRTRVAAMVRAVEQQPTWRAGVERIEVVERTDARLRYIEHGGNGAIAFAFREVAPDAEFHSVIDTDSLPFGGEWTIVLSPIDDTHTRVTITESGIVRSALFRFVSRYLMGHTRTIDAYLRDLNGAVGQ